jgi:outer membrane protein assembly factor BamB
VVAGKRVYVAAFEPNGPVASRAPGKLRRAEKDLRRVAANDVLYCIDADTGQTLWKASFAKGLNMIEHAHSGHYVPCVTGGRVYWVGTIGRMYCVDAETGKHIWDRPVDGWAEHTYRYRAWCIRERKLPRRPSRDYQWKKARQGENDRQQDAPEPEDNDGGDLCDEDAQARARARAELGLQGSRGWGWDSPVIAAGEDIVVTNTPSRAFVAFDARTGRKLWQARNATSATRAPVIWTHKGKHYVIGLSHGGLKCFDARTGKKLWSSGLAKSGSYGGNTPPISGDIIVTQGHDGEDAVGWSALRLTLDGPQRLWMFRRPIRCTYESPVIYKGHVWIALRNPCRWRGDQQDYLHKLAPKVFTRERFKKWDADRTRGAIGVVELETGQFTAVLDGGLLGCSSMVAGDGRIFFQQGNSLAMLRADPHNPEHLGRIYPENLWSTTPTYAAGRLYQRGCEHTLNCWELRKDPPAATAAKKVDPANARYTVGLEYARVYEEGLDMAFQRGGTAKSPDCEDLKLHLRTRDGKIVQSWITYGPDHNVPDWVFPETLKLSGNRLHGRFDALVLGREYPMELNLEVDGNAVAGYWDDRFQSNPVKGKIVGESRPVADGTGRVKLRIRREWCGGQNKNFETHLEFEMKDGQAVADSATIKARVPKASWEGEIVELSATQKGRKLTGTFTAKLKSNNLVRSGFYRVKFTTDVLCNRPAGTYRSWYGGREITPRGNVNNRIWGTFEVPEDTAVDPANAMHEFVLKDVMPNESDLRISVELRNGKAVHTKARTPRHTRGAHKVNFSDVKLKGNRLIGPVDVVICTDGFCPPHDIPCEFDIDLTVTKATIAGKYDGVYEKRESRSGSAEGTVRPSKKPTGE